MTISVYVGDNGELLPEHIVPESYTLDAVVVAKFEPSSNFEAYKVPLKVYRRQQVFLPGPYSSEYIEDFCRAEFTH